MGTDLFSQHGDQFTEGVHPIQLVSKLECNTNFVAEKTLLLQSRFLDLSA